MPVELSGGIYQMLSPWGPIVLIGALAWLSACFVGRWKFVSPEEHRPAMDI